MKQRCTAAIDITVLQTVSSGGKGPYVSNMAMQYSDVLLIQRDPRPHSLMLHGLMLCYPVVYKCRYC
jgi:hypothetical protein